MSAEDRNEGNDEARRELRKLAYEDADRTFAKRDLQRLSPRLPLDPPKLQWKDLIGDPEPKTAKDGVLDPKPPVPDPKQPWMEPKAPWFEPKQPWRDPEPKSVISDKGGFDPKQVFDPPKHLLDPPKPQWKDLVGDPEPKRIVGDPKHPKVDIDPDPKAILDPKNIYDPPKLAYDPGPILDPGRVFDPGRLVDPGVVARRPFVLGMPHHAPGAGMMAGADPRATTMMRPPEGQAGRAQDQAALLEATLAQVESSMRMLKEDLERLDDYYRELRDQYDELEAAHGGDSDSGEDGNDPAEEDGE